MGRQIETEQVMVQHAARVYLEADLAITVQVQHVKALLGLCLLQEVLHILQQHMIPAHPSTLVIYTNLRFLSSYS